MVFYKPEDFYQIWAGDETTGLLAVFFGLTLPHKRLLVEIFLSSILYTLMGLAGAFYFKYLIDTVLADGLVRNLHIVSTGILILTILQVAMNAFRSHLLLYPTPKCL